MRTLLTIVLLASGVLLSKQLATGHSAGEALAADERSVDAPGFRIEFLRGKLRIEGHTQSAGHERRLSDTATRAFPSAEADLVFVPFGIVPDYWQDSTLLLLDALAATHSASATLSPGSVSIKGIGTADWPRRERELQASLPEPIELSIDMTIADPGVDIAAVCARALSTYRSGDIRFKESGTEFRRSAYGELQRLVAIADTCRDSTIAITGHSDSSGEESSNRRLSLARATAVADYLHWHGVAAHRLLVTGAGSGSPVADNATRHGRSLNRRIDIELRPGAPDPVSPRPARQGS